MLWTISYCDGKGGIERSRIFRKSYARYRKHGWDWMIQRLRREYVSIRNHEFFNEREGRLSYNPDKETVVFVSHESSATGAPLLGYNIANKLSDKYNIIHIVIKQANIHDSFLDNCDLMLSGIEGSPYIGSKFFLTKIIKQRSVKCVICNSVVTYPVVQAAHDLNIPTLSLIHEFSEYTRPFGTMFNTLKYADEIIVPATIIQESLKKEVFKSVDYKCIPNNIHIVPQGKLPYIPETYGDDDSAEELYAKLKIHPADDIKIIVASGFVQIRKGVDSFISTARYIKQLYQGKCKFVWVGDGYNPEGDLAYSVWLQREIEFSGLDDDFIFLEHQKNLDAIFSIADVFCMTSRMDPFPNVVIDALSHDLHIACFNHASGSVEFLQKHEADCTVADYLDTYRLAKGLVRHLESNTKKTGVNKLIVEKYLDFNTYVQSIDTLMDTSVKFKAKSRKMVDTIIESGEFDSAFYGGEDSDYINCRNYVENALKGIHTHNPKPGFSENKWLTENFPTNPYIVPLYEALQGEKTKTHDVIMVPNVSAKNIDFVYAVHLHLFYLDLVEEFVDYFSCLPGIYDVFVTHTDENNSDYLEKAFASCGARRIKIICVVNIGRDIGALLCGLKDEVVGSEYEVLGHFHSKKSTDIPDAVGNRWRRFLMENLIGDVHVARSVLQIFNDSSVGLVFPEDAHVVDIGENKEFVDRLCKILNIPMIKQTPIFPLGNMFWARVDAIKELFILDSAIVLQKEPLPYDGSYMHAIERITPYLVENSGYLYKTVYKEGKKW